MNVLGSGNEEDRVSDISTDLLQDITSLDLICFEYERLALK